MLLKDVNKPSLNRALGTINKYLRENHGVTVSSVDEESALQMRDSLVESIQTLKQNNLSPKDPSFTKLLMMKSAVDTILEHIDQERPHRTYRRVVGHLYDAAVKLIELGDDTEEAVATVMKEYRSSPYRFPDYEVQFDLTNRLQEFMQNEQVAVSEDQQMDMFGHEDEVESNDVEYWLCDDCTMGVVNDDFTAIDDEGRYEEVSSCVYSIDPPLSLGDEVDELSNQVCDCCGTTLAGTRTQFWQLQPTNINSI